MMSKRYRLNKVSAEKFKYIVFSVDYSRIDDYVSDLAADLRKKSYVGSVVFDLLLSNGPSDRYVSAEFDGKEFLKKSIKPVADVEDKIKRASSQFYCSRPEFLEQGVLTRTQRFLARRQCPN